MSEIPNEKLKQLLGATAHGDAIAFKTLYDQTSPRLHAVALTIMRDSDLAEDVLQDAFVQVWHRASDFHADRGSVLTWLTTIVRYRAIDLLRKRGRDGSSGTANPIDIDPATIDYLQNHNAENDDDRLFPARLITLEQVKVCRVNLRIFRNEWSLSMTGRRCCTSRQNRKRNSEA